MRKEEAWAN